MAAGCAGAPPHAQSNGVPTDTELMSIGSFNDWLRRYYRMPLSHAKERTALRERLIGALVSQKATNYEAGLSQFEAIAALYRREDWDQCRLSQKLKPVAESLYTLASHRGDEAGALSALLALECLSNRKQSYHVEYQKLADWTQRARVFGGGEGSEGLSQIWSVHAELTPSSRVIHQTAKIYSDQRATLDRIVRNVADRSGSASQAMLGRLQALLREIKKSPYALAEVYLRVEAFDEAASVLRKLKRISGDEAPLADLIEEAAHDRERLVELVRVYAQSNMLTGLLALCRYGVREHRDDARFSMCLARLSAADNDANNAMGWYELALSQEPDSRQTFDEVLQTYRVLIEQREMDTNPASLRTIAEHAKTVLDTRMAHWKQPPPPLSASVLYRLLGQAEMNAGDVDKAERYFQQSLKDNASVEVYQYLGLLYTKLGRFKEAIAKFESGLSKAKDTPTAARDFERAELLNQLADASRLSGDDAKAKSAYRQALGAWQKVYSQKLSQLPSEVKGSDDDNGLRGIAANGSPGRNLLMLSELHIGIIWGRLGDVSKMATSFRKTLQMGPQWKEAYGQMLSFLASKRSIGNQDVELGLEIYRQALRQLTLDADWKVYFALWCQNLIERLPASAQVAWQDDKAMLLRGLTEGATWSARLASFGEGKLKGDPLLKYAASVGERTEAYFYQAMKLLAASDKAGAKAMLGKVIDLKMVGFYEYVMAQELMAGL